MKNHSSSSASSLTAGFSLIEVILALGIFLVTVLVLVGLMAPTLKSVDEVEQSDEAVSVVNSVNAFLQSSPDIAQGTDSKFETIYTALASGQEATLFVFRTYLDASSTDLMLKIGFKSDVSVGKNAKVVATDFENAAGSIYRVVLTPSSVIPQTYRSATRDATTGVYALTQSNVANYPEGYLAMEVRIFVQEPSPDFDPDKLAPYGSGDVASLAALVLQEPIFTYNTAIVR
ncbi:MAG: type II secretory pathway pseudopilin PulG [Lentimonas sp.]|jgi:type II secretory pathway pseudopilin PulG